MNHRIFLYPTAVALAAGLFGSPVLAQSADSIIIYNAQHETLGQAWTDAFTKETGIAVTMRNGDDSEFGNQLVAEGAASPADVFLTENSPAMALVDAAGLLAPVDAATLAQVPQAYRPAHGNWVGIAARSTVFVYDKTRLTEDQLPKSMLDLADPAWKGRWAASPNGADFQAIIGALLELKGQDATATWLAAMKDNVVTYRGNSTVMKAVNAHEVEGGLIFHYYYIGDQAETGENSANIGQHYFKNQDPGAFVSLSGGGVLASSTHQAAAQAFLKWVTGPAGQAILKDGDSFEYAVNGASNPALVPLADLDAPEVDPSKLDSRTVIDLMTAAGLL